MAKSNNWRDNDAKSWKTNTTDNGVDRRTCDITTHSKLDDVVSALGGDVGTPFFADDQRTVSTPGTPETLISVVVPAATTRRINKVRVSCTKLGKFEVKINSTVVGTGRTGPGEMNVEFNFNPARPASATDTISITFNQLRGAATDVEAYLMAMDET